MYCVVHKKTVTEDKRDEVSVILAGYEDDFNKKFFAYNPGLRSRFQEILFEDFNEGELSQIWENMRQKKHWCEEDNVQSVVIRRLVKSTGRKGFGNARDVRKVLESATQSAMTRLGNDLNEESMELKIVDIIGEDPMENQKIQVLLKKVESKIGWGKVKETFKELIQLCSTNYSREVDGQPPLEIFLNRMFLGNPGTGEIHNIVYCIYCFIITNLLMLIHMFSKGKTTCAKLYGELLKQLGFLSIGDVVTKTAGDFMGQVVGESQNKTISILDGAKGKVLIIDEAYALDDNLYGKQVLDILVEKVQGTPSDDIAVLLLGYEEPMLSMIQNQNPGLSRRFPKDYAFYFDDYNDSELHSILKLNLNQMSITATYTFQQEALSILRAQREQVNFGNAGAVELLLKSAVQKMAQRDSSRLEDTDIEGYGSNKGNKDIDPLSLLDKLYKMENIKEKLQKLRAAFTVATREGEEKPDLGHFVFTGSPGTGKTTVARTIAQVLYSLGLIPTNNFVESSGLELTAEYVGQTKTKVKEVLQKSKGGILFIDEAYNIGFGHFGKEACDTLVAAMTSEEFKDLVIVIAGYDADIHKMLDGNAGLKSRFTEFFNFPDWEILDCIDFFQSLASKKNFSLEKGVTELLSSDLQHILQLDGWGNGRDVVRIWKSALTYRASRVADDHEIERTITISDTKEALDDLLNSRQPKGGSLLGSGSLSNNMNLPMASLDREGLKPKCDTQSKEKTSRKKDEEKDDNITKVNERDEGVTDQEWDELQMAKEDMRRKEEELEQQKLDYLRFLKEKEEEERLARIALEEEMERIKKELEEDEQREAERKLIEEEEHKKELIRIERKRRDDEEKRRLEKLSRLQATREKLQQIRPCPMGFNWFKTGSGWTCGGGSHFVSDEELRRQFSS